MSPDAAPTPITTDDGQEVRPFTDFLDEFRRGLLRDEVSRELHALIGDVIAVDKGGSLTLTLKVAPIGGMQIEVTGEVSSKRPKAAAPKSLFYVDRDGNPTRHDPTQTQLFQED